MFSHEQQLGSSSHRGDVGTRVFTCRYPAFARQGESLDISVLLMTVTLKITCADERMRMHTETTTVSMLEISR